MYALNQKVRTKKNVRSRNGTVPIGTYGIVTGIKFMGVDVTFPTIGTVFCRYGEVRKVTDIDSFLDEW